ncbi:MAG TPA: alpha/beta hydrolase [Thermoanaerobaculia bacterium]|nr:alpha/beta hydrolase [Thermoanaerobaculia bacterium]
MGALRESSTFTAADGLVLHVEHHRLPRARGRVLIVHGYAEHHGRYDPLVAALLAAGFEPHQFDLRGHGRSHGEPRGHVDGFEQYRRDLAGVLAAVEARAPAAARPLFVLGHSLGGLIVLDHALHRATAVGPAPVAGLVLSSPYLGAVGPARTLLADLVAHASPLAPRLQLDSGLEADGLSRDPAVVAAYRSDPMVFGTVSPGWLHEIRDAQRRVLARAGEIAAPTLLLLGEDDPVAAPERGRELFAALGAPDKELHVYPGFLHEVFNETGRERVVADLLTWLERRSPSPGA